MEALERIEVLKAYRGYQVLKVYEECTRELIFSSEVNTYKGLSRLQLNVTALEVIS